MDQTAVNGVYHYIDDILSYGVTLEESPWPTNRNINVQEAVFSERIRLDCTSLSPDFITSGARGHFTKSTIQNGRYGRGGQGAKAATNVNTCLGFKAGTAAKWTYTDETHVHVRNRVIHFWSYQGDEVIVKGRFDVAIELPAVPVGEWELRMFTCTGFSSRGIVQYYIDDKPQGIPFDMRPGGEDNRIGWKSDSSLGDEEQVAAFSYVLDGLREAVPFHPFQFGGGPVFHVAGAFHLHSEGVLGAQVVVFLLPHLISAAGPVR